MKKPKRKWQEKLIDIKRLRNKKTQKKENGMAELGLIGNKINTIE